MAPFYGWGSIASRLEPLRGGILSIKNLALYKNFFVKKMPQKLKKFHKS